MSRTSTVHAVTTIGIDMGKNTLHMIGLDTRGGIVLREKVSLGRITLRLANLPPCLIGIEAGMATHYVARELAALGHDVKQVPPAYAKPFRQGHKNDFRDAHGVAEAVQRPTTRFVPAKTDEQLDLQALHRVRSRLVSERTAIINQIRARLEHYEAARSANSVATVRANQFPRGGQPRVRDAASEADRLRWRSCSRRHACTRFARHDSSAIRRGTCNHVAH